MDWLRRITRPPSHSETTLQEVATPEVVERATPGVAALMEGVSEDRSHAVLDLGPAAPESFRLYSRFARWVRFADLIAATSVRREWTAALAALPSNPVRPYDLLFAWDIFDRLPPNDRPGLVERLTAVSAPDARLYVVVDTSGSATSQGLRFTLLDVDRMRFEATATGRPSWPALLPAEVERLLEPFHVVRAFTSQVGLREYVAVRRNPSRPGQSHHR